MGAHMLVTTRAFDLALAAVDAQPPAGSVLFRTTLGGYLMRTNPPLLSPGAGAFTAAAWFVLEDAGLAVVTHPIMGKWNGATNKREWDLSTQGPNVRGRLSLNGTTSVDVSDLGFAALQSGPWYMGSVRYDGITTMWVNTNADLGQSSAAVPSPLFTGNADFQIGGEAIATGQIIFDGAIGFAGYWSRKLSDVELNTLYSAGQHLTFAALPAGLLVGLVAYWQLIQPPPGPELDSTANALNLTIVPTVLNAGPPP